ncbi:MAG TPA: geranylgeranylglycerol-phosphate geranylgeranyltransferase [Puia sp.]|uniref:geranylgeranylglycerol-phosphate geranylgeranyltransferase n=1 Tax=Puia sp. TaxID=2045100 RepID=UPI002D09C636|nr:geranylgeranylglycerol-phosphate geranylgeranyltransferase [Puia sp.]HVU96203.1 geranylgeranylglycerol-phosphate geranylgeranyltransferase [Puia sp.]
MPQLIGAFFRLIRWPNLVFIFLTQLLFYYFILLPCYGWRYVEVPAMIPKLTPLLFYLLSASSVLIAAAGYAINDYFDLNIDRVNKPKRMVVEKVIKRRWTILWHWLLSGIGVVLSLYVSWRIRNPIIAVANLGCVVLLYFYSTTFKRKLLIGNVIISLLTAWVILVLFVCEARITTDPIAREISARIFKFAIVYGSFAFIISLVREVVKDIEDRDGDEKYGCRTMPIVWGVNVAKVFAGTWLVVLIGALIIFQFYVLQKAWWQLILYSILLIDLPCLWLLRKLYRAQTREQYHLMSNVIKGVMLTGICSMLLVLSN